MSTSQRRHVNFESSSTVSCHCLHGRPPCVAVAIPATAALTARPIHVSRGRKDAGPGVHFVSPGLLQLTVLQHHRRSDEPVAVCPECGWTLVSGARRYDHITPVLQELHWLPVQRRVTFKMATLVYLSLSGVAPAYPPTVSWSPTKVVVSCVLPHQGRAL